MLPNLLASLVCRSRHHSRLVALIGLVIGVMAAWYASGHLGVSTDTDAMFAESLPWRHQAMMLARDFPQFEDLIVVVIDGREPEEADATAAALAAALDPDHVHFRSVRRPDASPYLAREGLLFLDQSKLDAVLGGITDAQPFLGQLSADPSARGLFSSLALLGLGVTHGQADLTPYAAALKGFHRALGDAIAGRPRPLSWAGLIGGGISDLAGPFRFVLVQPRLDFGSLEPGGAATAAIRAAASDLEFVKSGEARVRITGSVALADEEFATVAQGAVAGLAGSVVLITIWLFWALHSWRLIVPVLCTLTLGLILTLFFAACAVGTLNLVSVGFGILFVGIAVDFSIQFAVRSRDARWRHATLAAALDEMGRRVGFQIFIAACATAAGFLSFVPTAFSGVAELGLIAGVGMLFAFLCTMTFLPAMFGVCHPRPERGEIGFRFAMPLDAAVARRRWLIIVVGAVLAVSGLALVPLLRFDSDPLHTKDPHTEAMRTLADLMSSPLTSPYSADILVADAGRAAALTPRLEALPLVAQVTTINSLVPEDQPPKLAAIADAASVLGATLAPREAAAPVTAADLRLAAKTAADQIEPALPRLAKDDPLAAIAADLRTLSTASDATLIAADRALTRFLPSQLDQLRLSLSAEPATIATVPDDLKRDWLLPDGQARISVVAKPEARDSRGLHAFVDQIGTVAPGAGGSAVTIVATAETIVGSFREAAGFALAAITAILFVALRRPRDVLLVLAPLLLSALMTVIVVVALRMPINFANIIALPLLLGVGVSFNIYFVMNWRGGRPRVLGSPTARAVTFSALTTGSAFGSLALSRHPGTASMGTLLLISLGCTLVATLVFIPALLATLAPRQPARTLVPEPLR